MWTLHDVQRHADVLLCVVRWVCPHKSTKPFSVAEVSLIESEVRWKYYATQAEGKKESKRCAGASIGHRNQPLIGSSHNMLQPINQDACISSAASESVTAR